MKDGKGNLIFLPLRQPLRGDKPGVLTGHLHQVHAFGQIAYEVAVSFGEGKELHLAAQHIEYCNALDRLVGTDAEIVHRWIGEYLERRNFRVPLVSAAVAGISQLRLSSEAESEKEECKYSFFHADRII